MTFAICTYLAFISHSLAFLPGLDILKRTIAAVASNRLRRRLNFEEKLEGKLCPCCIHSRIRLCILQ